MVLHVEQLSIRHTARTVTRTAYDHLGRSTWQAERYHAASQAGGGVVTRTVYDSLGRVQRTERYRDTLISLTSAVGGMQESVEPVAESGNLLSVNQTEYDSAGRVHRTHEW